MDPDSRLLRSFLAVADARNVGRAAKALGLTQPALTRQLQKLEAQVGATLLTRLPRGVELTEAGRVLAVEARHVVNDWERAAERARRAADGDVGHLSVSFLATAAETTMAPMLQALRERHPGVAFSLTERLWVRQTEGLDSGKDDVAFVRDLDAAAGWSTLTLLEEAICLVVAPDHALAHRNRVELHDIRVDPVPFLTISDWIARREVRWGFRVQVGDQVSSPEALFSLVRVGLGRGLLPASYERRAPSGVRFLPVADETSVQQLAWSTSDEHATTRLFVGLARERVAAAAERLPSDR